MEAKVALIGSGNAFFKDEGIGLYAGKYLKENFTYEPLLDIVDGGTLGFRLMPLLQEYEHVIIANTSSDDSKAVGTITVMSGDELIANQGIKKTANEVEITEMLQICSMANHCAHIDDDQYRPRRYHQRQCRCDSGITSAVEQIY